jgi:hypothetical protein
MDKGSWPAEMISRAAPRIARSAFSASLSSLLVLLSDVWQSTNNTILNCGFGGMGPEMRPQGRRAWPRFNNRRPNTKGPPQLGTR